MRGGSGSGIGGGLSAISGPSTPRAGDELDAQAVGVQQVARVVRPAVLGSGTGCAVVAPAVVQAGTVGTVDCGAARGRERDMAVARRRRTPARDDPELLVVATVGN